MYVILAPFWLHTGFKNDDDDVVMITDNEDYNLIIANTREGEEGPVDYSDQPPDHPAPSLPLEVIRSQNTPSYR